MKILMHYNATLPHQRQHAHAFIKGSTDIYCTDKPTGEADVHIISGPHFALGQLRNHPRVLMVDRAWWGDPVNVSIGWLRPDGPRKFAQGEAERPKPELMPWKAHGREDSCLILADYQQDVGDITYFAKQRFTTVDVRLHPAECTNRHITSLEAALTLHDVAIGHSGTSLFTAIQLGVPSICTDPLSQVAPVCANSVDDDLFRGGRDHWLHDMSYKQFSLDEIADGTAWGQLKDVQ